MTGTCALCGEIVEVNPDAILDEHRMNRMFQRYGALVTAHLVRHHKPEAQLGFVAGEIVKALVTFTFFKTDEEQFAEQLEDQKQKVLEALNQKSAQERNPLVVVP